MEQQEAKKLDFDEVQDFVARAQQQGYPLDFTGDIAEGSPAWVRLQIANLEGMAAKGPLSDIDAQYLVSLRDALGRGNVQEFVFVENLLREKLGKNYAKFVRRRGKHSEELKRLEAINAELQKEVELAAQLRGGAYPRLNHMTTEIDEVSGGSVDVPNTLAAAFEGYSAQARIDPGTYIVDVDKNHRLTSFKVEPKTSEQTATSLGGKIIPVSFWTRVYNWFFLLGRYRFGGSFRNRE